MDGDYASVTRRQLERGELVAIFARLAVLVALALIYVITSRPARLLDTGNVVAALLAVVLVGYSGLCLRLLASSSFGPLLADLSGVLDAATGSVFLWLALHAPDGGTSVALAGAAAMTFPVVFSVSLLRLSRRNVVIAATASVVGSTAAVFPSLIAAGDQAAWAWLYVPLGCFVLGGGAVTVAFSTLQLLERHLVTAELQRASRRLRMTMEIVQVAIANFVQFVNNLERVSATLSEGARNQARSIERISSAISALNSSQEEINRATETSAKTLRRSADSSETGNRVVRRVMEEVRSISDVVDRMVSSLEHIDDIADNTNLLALNANIEANRGGPESMGFSVVADEIRNLAEQSQETALEVGRLVKQIVKATFTADASSKSAGEVFGKIDADLAGYSEYVNNLHVSVQVQLKANRDVQRAITRIHQVTVENTQAADGVRQVVAELQKEVGKLKALVDGKVTETAALS